MRGVSAVCPPACCRRERDAAVVAKEQVTVLVDRKTAHYKSEVSELQALVDALTRKHLVLQRELDKVRSCALLRAGCVTDLLLRM